jgi:hypothetical protein
MMGYLQIKRSMESEQLQHMIKKADTSRYFAFATAFQIESDRDIGLIRGPSNLDFCHLICPGNGCSE